MIKTNRELGLFILRCFTSILMLFHGYHKLISNCAGVKGILAANGLPTIFAYGVLVGEIIAPILILVGYRTRFASLIYIINCLVAILLVHRSQIFSFNSHGGWAIELIGLYLFAGITLFFTGGGKIALSSKNRWD